MTYIDYLNQFWKAQEEYMLPATAIALYAYLLKECNRRSWKMPFTCSTVVICDNLHVCKTALTTARKSWLMPDSSSSPMAVDAVYRPNTPYWSGRIS